MFSIKMVAILCCFVLLALKHCCESVQCDQNGTKEEVHDQNSWYTAIAPMVPEGDEEMRGLLCELDKVRPLVEEMANAKLDQEQKSDMGQSKNEHVPSSTQRFYEIEPKPSGDKSILTQKMNKGIRRMSTGFKRVTDGLARWPKLVKMYKSLRSGEFYRKIVAKNPKMAKIIPLLIECARGIRSKEVPKLMGQLQNFISQIAKVEGVDLTKVPPMEIEVKKNNKNDILTVTKVLMKIMFRREKSKGSDGAGMWTVFRAWKTLTQTDYFAMLFPQNYGIDAFGNGHRRMKRVAIAIILIIVGSIILLLLAGALYGYLIAKCCT